MKRTEIYQEISRDFSKAFFFIGFLIEYVHVLIENKKIINR